MSAQIALLSTIRNVCPTKASATLTHSHSHSLNNICPDQMSICMSQDGLSEGGSLVFDASDVVGLIAVVFNLTKQQKRLRQLRLGSSCLPMSPSVIYTVTASYGRQQKATYCRKNINLSLQLIIFLISWPRLPSQGNDTAGVHLGQTHNSPTAPPSKEKTSQTVTVNIIWAALEEWYRKTICNLDW